MAAKNKASKETSRAPGQLPDRSRKAGVDLDAGEVIAQTSTGLVNFVYDHRVAISAIIIGIFAIAGLSTLWRHHGESKNAEGAARIYEIEKKLPEDDDALAALGIDLSNVERTDEEKAKRQSAFLEVAKELESVGKAYASVPSGHVAYMERARLLKKAGKTDLAIEAYKQALEAAGDEDLFKFAALNGLGNLLVDQGKYDEAEAAFRQMADELSGVWREQGLYELGRVQEMAGKTEEARKTYETFLENYSGSSWQPDVEKRLAGLKGGQVPGEKPQPVGKDGQEDNAQKSDH